VPRSGARLKELTKKLATRNSPFTVYDSVRIDREQVTSVQENQWVETDCIESVEATTGGDPSL